MLFILLKRFIILSGIVLTGNWIIQATEDEVTCNQQISGKTQCTVPSVDGKTLARNFTVNGLKIVADDEPQLIGTYDGHDTIRWKMLKKVLTKWTWRRSGNY